MTDPHNPKFHTSEVAETIAFLGDIINVSRITFLQANNASSPITLDFSQKTIPANLIERLNFSLSLTFELTNQGKAIIQCYSNQFISCQIQTFVKPLGPICSSQHWKSSISIALSLQQNRYRVEFQPTSLTHGIYNLQLLILINNLRTSPILLEIPAFQVIKQAPT